MGLLYSKCKTQFTLLCFNPAMFGGVPSLQIVFCEGKGKGNPIKGYEGPEVR